MRLARFKTFVRNVCDDRSLAEFVNSVNVYRYFNDAWYDQDDQRVTDDALLADLNRTRARGTHWRDVNSCTSYFPVSTLDGVVQAAFTSAAAKRTRDRVAGLLDEVVERTQHEFAAAHDQLTGLPNREEFQRILLQRLEDRYEAQPAPSQTDAAISTGEQTIALMAVDIDHFKQVNDTHGHIYGDVVLHCFARRLESFARRLRTEHTVIDDIDLARPSGEEFLVLMAGAFGPDAARRHGDALCSTIAAQPLPTVDEWSNLSDEEKRGVDLPRPDTERTITISVGISSVSSSSPGQSRNVAETLQAQADVALYSAKAGGRNRARHFEDIVSRYGRVLEHHPDTGIVAIDIGQEVGVALGQEFLVFHPDFTGKTPFTFDDGRTKRSLGTYPRDSNGRIVVFDVQEGVSFCRVAERTATTSFAQDSHLEAVPLGSITHLIGSRTGVGLYEAPGLATAEELDARAAEIVAADGFPSAVVFLLDEEDRLHTERGTAFVNEALAKLYGALRDRFRQWTYVVESQKTNIEVVVPADEIGDAVAVAGEVARSATENCEHLATFSAAVFARESTTQEDAGDRSSLQPAKAIEYARFAAVAARETAESAILFTPRLAARVLYLSRSKQRFEHGLQDYKTLSALGVRNSLVENQAALCAMEQPSPNVQLALSASAQAVELDPENAVFSANHALALVDAGEYVRAYSRWMSLQSDLTELGNMYHRYFARCVLAAFRTDPTAVDRTPALQLLDQLEQHAQAADDEDTREEVSKAIAALREEDRSAEPQL